MQSLDRLGEDDLKSNAAQLKEMAEELAGLVQDDSDAWLAEVNRRLERTDPEPH